MPVKIISIVPPPEILKRVLCRNCGATLEYTEDVVKKYIGHDYSGGPDGKEWIVCPNCGKDVTIRSW